jgi:hypothetical protein
MRKFTRFIASLVFFGLAMAPLLPSARAQDVQSPLTLMGEDSTIHIFPTVPGNTGTLAPALVPTGPLVYHGGPVMTNLITYAIFWVPAKLQNGTPTSTSASYRPILKRLLTDYPGHGIDNNNTQYYKIIGSPIYIRNTGSFGGAFVDTSPYPPSGCSNSARPGGCLTDHQIQNEIKKVMALNGWTGGLQHMFLVFTSDGEGSCTSAASTICSYVISPPGYCAYHGAFFNAALAPIVYGNIPYGDLSVCQAPSEPSPNGDAIADAVTSTVSHEVTEAITDPIPPSGWFENTFGFEIGDLCAYNYGTPTWASNEANEMWNGNPYLLQQEWDNHEGGCVQVGP